jgi:hypothetical protein
MFWYAPVFFLLGAVSSPVVTKVLKPVLREVIKGGVLIALEVKKAASSVTEDLQDIAAEAAHEVRTEKPM